MFTMKTNYVTVNILSPGDRTIQQLSLYFFENTSPRLEIDVVTLYT